MALSSSRSTSSYLATDKNSNVADKEKTQSSGGGSFFQRFVMRARRKSYSPTPSATVFRPQQRPGLLATIFGTSSSRRKGGNDEKRQHVPLVERHQAAAGPHSASTPVTPSRPPIVKFAKVYQLEVGSMEYVLCDEFLASDDDIMNEADIEMSVSTMAATAQPVPTASPGAKAAGTEKGATASGRLSLSETSYALKSVVRVLMAPAQSLISDLRLPNSESALLEARRATLGALPNVEAGLRMAPEVGTHSTGALVIVGARRMSAHLEDTASLRAEAAQATLQQPVSEKVFQTIPYPTVKEPMTTEAERGFEVQQAKTESPQITSHELARAQGSPRLWKPSQMAAKPGVVPEPGSTSRPRASNEVSASDAKVRQLQNRAVTAEPWLIQSAIEVSQVAKPGTTPRHWATGTQLDRKPSEPENVGEPPEAVAKEKPTDASIPTLKLEIDTELNPIPEFELIPEAKPQAPRDKRKSLETELNLEMIPEDYALDSFHLHDSVEVEVSDHDKIAFLPPTVFARAAAKPELAEKSADARPTVQRPPTKKSPATATTGPTQKPSAQKPATQTPPAKKPQQSAQRPTPGRSPTSKPLAARPPAPKPTSVTKPASAPPCKKLTPSLTAASAIPAARRSVSPRPSTKSQQMTAPAAATPKKAIGRVTKPSMIPTQAVKKVSTTSPSSFSTTATKKVPPSSTRSTAPAAAIAKKPVAILQSTKKPIPSSSTPATSKVPVPAKKDSSDKTTPRA